MMVHDLFNKGVSRPAAIAPDSWDDFWYAAQGRETTSGVRITPDRAMQVVTVMACTRVVVETIASLPFHIMEWLARGSRKAIEHPLYALLHDQPNSWQTSFEFWEMMYGHLLLRGNAYAEKMSGRGETISEVIPLHPDKVRVRPALPGSRSIVYEVDRPATGDRIFLNQQQVFHMRDFSSDGLVGLSRIELHADAIGVTVALEQYRASQLKNQTVPCGMVEHPGKLSEKAHANLRASFEMEHQGPLRAGRVGILQEGMTYHEIGLSNKDAELLEFMRADVQTICRIFRVPPHKVADLSDATYSNIEHSEIGFTQDSLMPWIVRGEKAISRDLITDSKRFFPKWNMDGLLRGDAKSRNEARQTQLRNGALSRNEWRELDDLNPVDDGDEYYLTADLILATEIGKKEDVPPALPFPPDDEEDENEDDNEQEEVEGAGEDADAEEALVLTPVPTAGVPGWARVMLVDIAERLTAAEIRGLDKRAKRGCEDMARFETWAGEFYAGHIDYALRSLGSLGEALLISDGLSVNWESAVRATYRDALATITGGNPGETLDGWRSSRACSVADRLLEVIYDAQGITSSDSRELGDSAQQATCDPCPA